jgi:hypothetical protein
VLAVHLMLKAMCCVQVGAFMNEAYQAQHGLEPGLFPEAVPTYLGHYHLPHTVGASNVRYVGSPYQGMPPAAQTSLHVKTYLPT